MYDIAKQYYLNIQITIIFVNNIGKDFMDQLIGLSSKLKNHISQRSSAQDILPSQPQVATAQEDIQYQLMRKQILSSSYMQNANQHVRIRLINWVKRLDRIKTNRVWIANRNNYIKLLNLMCHCEYITHPFMQLPPQRDLLNLPKHQINKIIDQIERQIKTSRFNSRKGSVNGDSTCSKYQINSINFHSDLKRFKTETNTCGEEDSDTIPIKKLNGVRTFQTDFDDKTISFNLSSDNNLGNCTLQNEGELDESDEPNYQTKKLKSSSLIKKTEFKQITNYPNRTPLKQRGNSMKKTQKNLLSFKKKPPMYKKIKINRKQERQEQNNQQNGYYKKEYWQSNDITGNNSGSGTPKYLDKYQWSEEKISKQVQIVSHRNGEDQNCDCTSKVLGTGWLFEFFKKIVS